jgi:alpha-tubulin suppressor-like RCC1 family protein
LENGEDFLDVSVGFDHIVVLTTENEVYVVGQGENGQLGLGKNVTQLKGWQKVSLPADGKRIVGVHAGYKNTFLLLENIGVKVDGRG